MAEFDFKLPAGQPEEAPEEEEFEFALPADDYAEFEREAIEQAQLLPDEEWVNKYSYAPIGEPVPDGLRYAIAPVHAAAAGTWDYVRGAAQNFMTGLGEDYAMSVWERLDRWSNYAADSVNKMIADSLLLSDPFGRVEPGDEEAPTPEIVPANDFFKDLYLDAYINASEVETDDLGKTFFRLLGHAVPTTMELITFRKAAVERAAALQAGQLGQTATGVGSMFVYGGLQGGIAGATDLAALDMLNVVLGGFSWPIRTAGLSSYMAQQATLHGEEGNDVMAQGILGALYGMVGPAMGGPAEREMTMLLKTPIRDWLDSRPVPDILGKQTLGRPLSRVMEKNIGEYIKVHRPSLYDAVRFGEVEDFPGPFSSPLVRATDFIISKLGPESREGQRLNALEEMTKSELIRAWDRVLRETDKQHVLSTPERAKISHSLTEAVFEAEARFHAKGLKPEDVTRLPLGQEVTKPEGQIAAERPIDVVRKRGVERTTARSVKPAQQIVRLGDGIEVAIPKERAVEVQRSVAEHESWAKRQVELDKQRALSLQDAWTEMNRRAFDQQYPLKHRLEGLGRPGHETVLSMETWLNAPKAVQHRVARVSNAVMEGLTKQEAYLLNLAIKSVAEAGKIRRTAARGRGYESRGISAEGHDTVYQAVLEAVKPERRARFQAAIDRAFYETGEATLLRLHARGMIGDKDLQALRKLKYSPTVFASKIEELLGVDKDIPTPMQVPSAGIKRLQSGSKDIPVDDHLTLMFGHIAYMETRMYKNDVLQSLSRVADKVDTDLVRRPQLDAEGKPIVPEGYGEIKFMEGGQRKSLVMPKEYQQLLNLDPGLAEQLHWVAQLALGTPFVKTLATVANPEFAAAAFARDMAYMWLVDASGMGYSEFLPKAMGQMGVDALTVLPDILTYKLAPQGAVRRAQARLPARLVPTGERTEAFITDAGGFTLYGLYAHTATSGYGYRALFGAKEAPWKRAYFKTLNALSSITEIGEMTMRESYSLRLQKGGMSRAEANQTAMKALNFARKGTTMGTIDKFIPYANAAAQAFDNLNRSVVKDPAAFQAKVAQMVALQGSLYMTNMLTNPQGWEAMSNREKVRNYIFMLPRSFHYVDDRGNVRYGYVKLRKENYALYTAFDAALIATLDKAYYQRDPGPIMKEAMTSALPYNPGRLPPSLDALFAVGGFDTFFFEKVWRGEQREPGAEWTPDTPKPYVAIGESLNLSPARMEAAVNKVIPSNAALGFLGLAMDKAPEPVRSELYMHMWQRIPVLRRMVSFTTPLAQEAEELDAAYRRANTDRFYRVKDPMTNMLLDLRTGRKTNQEVEQMLRTGEGDYFSDEMTDLDRVKMAEMYKGYRETQAVWDRLEKQDPEIIHFMPSPFWFARMRGLGGEQRAVEYFEIWRDLPADRRKQLETLASGAGFLGNKEFRMEFDRLNKERGLSFLGEE